MSTDLRKREWLPALEIEFDSAPAWTFRTGRWRGWLGSFVFHGLLVSLLAWFSFQELQHSLEPGCSVHWQEGIQTEQFDAGTLDPAAKPAISGGSQSSPASMIVAESTQTKIDPRVRDHAFPAPANAMTTSTTLADYVGSLDGDARNGQGEGAGTGTDAGTGFFGDPGGARSFVFVLDLSGSMNNPHIPSGGITRFQRLQKELIGFLDRLDASQSFYVVFFNKISYPLPSKELVPATRQNIEWTRQWILSLVPEEETDPRGAIKRAMKLRPDLIYFLSDGEFDYDYQRHMLKYPTGEWKLHTFSIGSRSGQFMKVFAEKHGGRYTFLR